MVSQKKDIEWGRCLMIFTRIQHRQLTSNSFLLPVSFPINGLLSVLGCEDIL